MRAVFVDFEANADRADVAEHEIIEIGAVRVDGDRLDHFQTLVTPKRALSPDVTDLTGIQPEDLHGAPPLDEALRSFIAFCGTAPLIAHNGHRYDFPLLKASLQLVALERPDTPLLDSLELAHLVFPRAGSSAVANADGSFPPRARTLDALADFFSLQIPSDRHRALADSELTRRITELLLSELNRPSPHRLLQRATLQRGHHSWAVFLDAATPGDPDLAAIVSPPPKAVPQPRPTGLFDVDAVTAMFRSGGALIGTKREPREQQVEMARAVAMALSLEKRQLVEAPTGTGKTLAYLVPSIEFSRASGAPVIVAAHSKVLQDQIQSSLAELQGEIGPFSAAVLKGRENYVNLESLEAELDADPPDEDTALALALLVGWVAETPSGDWNDLRAWAIESDSPALRLLKWKLRVDAAPGPSRTLLDERDFYRRALKAVDHAQIAVFNHALLVSQSDWIGQVRHLIIDEAHNLEESVTGGLTEEVTDIELNAICDTIWNEERRWGTLGRLADAAGKPLTDPAIDAARKAVTEVRHQIRRLANPLIDYVRDRSGTRREEVIAFGTAYRVRPGIDTARPSYAEVLREGRVLRDHLRRLASSLDGLVVPAETRGRYRRHRLEAEISRLGRASRSRAELVDQVLGSFDADLWINIVDLRVDDLGWGWGVRRAPLSVASDLRDLWSATEAAVLTSATLQVNGSFSFIVRSLGLEGAETTALGTPFGNLRNQHMLVLTDYLPPPRGSLIDEFTQAEASEIARLILLASGRTMSLFTARSRLAEVKAHARPLVEQYGLPLLAQGDDPSPALVERMRSEVSSSLLALRSFWEGIDIPGEALSQLIIEKVPFDPPTDPIIAARVEALEDEGIDPFTDYLAPRAAVRFAQGVGRLIRGASDIGATVVLDSRLRRPVPYRDMVLGSLIGPPRIVPADSPTEAYQAIAAHLGIDLDESLWGRLDSIPTADPWAELDALSLTPVDMSNPAAISARLDKVRELFGFEAWRPGQLEAMKAFMEGRDVLAILPTGSGKSIAFQIPALLCPGVTIVVSPLIALMRDQAQNLRARGLTRVAAIHSGVPQSEQHEILRGANRGRYKLVYVSPERLWSPAFLNALRSIDIARIAIDEAHCVSQWGHSFRPEYAAIPTAADRIVDKRVPVMAVTATATERVRNEIREELQLRSDVVEVLRSPERPEIRYYTEHCEDFDDRDLRVVQVLESFMNQSSIVYVPKRKDTVRLAGLLRSAGHIAHAYHGAMVTEERIHVEDAFRHGEIDVVVATKAFGLGIDKPDIAAVVHLEMPATIEEYIQETGRVARGTPLGLGPQHGTCVLLVTPRDCAIHRYFTRSAVPDIEHIKRLWADLRPGTNYLPPESLEGGGDEGSAQSLALAIHYLTQIGAITRHPDIIWEGRVWVPADARQTIDELGDPDANLRRTAQRVLDLVDRLGSYDYQARTWARHLGLEPPDVESALLDLHARDIVGFATWKYAHNLERHEAVEPDWYAIERSIETRREHVRQLSDAARKFAHQDLRCRRVAMLSYLGVDHDSQCDACDRCQDLPRPWRESEVTREALRDAVPAHRIALKLIGDTSEARYSRRNLERSLLGYEGRGMTSTPARLTEHPLFGRLSTLQADGITRVINELITEGYVEQRKQILSTKDGEISYESLALTEAGQARLR